MNRYIGWFESFAQGFMQGKDDKNIRIKIDLKLLLCNWVYDLSFQVSRRTVMDLGYIERAFDLLPRDPELLDLREKLRAELADNANKSH